MSRPVVIDVASVSLAYRLYRKPADAVLESLFGGVRHDTFWALKDVSFQVREGERLGIVGPNGAGKSSLLQVIAGNVSPTGGKAAVHGNISSLLSLTPVWNGEDTGFENTRFNLLVQGVPERRVQELIEEIADFTELGAAMYRPVKTFSSGMSARLAFAIATAIDPEILIIDEVLGTGDAYFASKANRRMEEFCSRGKALLFVSHSTAAVQQFCDKALWMESGAVRLHGDVDFVLRQYELDFRRAEDEATRSATKRAVAAVSVADFADPRWLVFRLVPESGDHFLDTHYVRDIRVHDLVEPAASVELNGPARVDDSTFAVLDLFGSEWGRLFQRRAHDTRALAHIGGRRHGGVFRVRPSASRQTPFAVEVSSASIAGHERLALEFLDVSRAAWVRCALELERELDEGFRRQRFSGVFSPPSEDLAPAVLERAADAVRADVEIERVRLSVGDEETHTVREREPFTIHVDVHFRVRQPRADVGVKLTRADGVYVFWQSSGQSDGNLLDVQGRRTLRFRFDPNHLGAGEYFANVYVADGWDFPRNYPYARVFDRSIGALSFRIFPEFSGLDFGVVNQRVTVETQ